MVKLSFFVRLEAKPGKEAAVEEFLRAGQALAENEPATVAWFGVRLGPGMYAVFDASISLPLSSFQKSGYADL